MQTSLRFSSAQRLTQPAEIISFSTAQLITTTLALATAIITLIMFAVS